jgi:hypothetical protein
LPPSPLVPRHQHFRDACVAAKCNATHVQCLPTLSRDALSVAWLDVPGRSQIRLDRHRSQIHSWHPCTVILIYEQIHVRNHSSRRHEDNRVGSNAASMRLCRALIHARRTLRAPRLHGYGLGLQTRWLIVAGCVTGITISLGKIMNFMAKRQGHVAAADRV